MNALGNDAQWPKSKGLCPATPGRAFKRAQKNLILFDFLAANIYLNYWSLSLLLAFSFFPPLKLTKETQIETQSQQSDAMFPLKRTRGRCHALAMFSPPETLN